MIEIAKNAGFCFGVKRATDALEEAIAARSGERIYTLGTLIHNDVYNQQLAEAGVGITEISQIPSLVATATEEKPVRVLIRAHGIPKEDEDLLRAMTRVNPHFRYEDCTCPFVKKIHRIAAEYSSPEHLFVLIGQASHPEVVGIMSYFEYDKLSFETAEDLQRAVEGGIFEKHLGKMPILAAQTTQNLGE